MKEKLSHYEELLGDPDLDEEDEQYFDQNGDLQTDFERVGGYDLENRAEEILTFRIFE